MPDVKISGCLEQLPNPNRKSFAIEKSIKLFFGKALRNCVLRRLSLSAIRVIRSSAARTDPP
jgi:hypothetical protein